MTTPRTREDVVRAAGRLFAERGFHGTSMRDLGEEVGLLGSSLYSHIEGKEQLLLEVIRRGARMFQGLADDALAADGSVAQRLRTLIAGHVRIITDNIDESATFLSDARFLPAEARAELVELRDEYQRVYRTLLEAGAAAGDFPGLQDPAMTSTFVLSVLNALVRWYRPEGPSTPEEIAERMYGFVMGGIG